MNECHLLIGSSRPNVGRRINAVLDSAGLAHLADGLATHAERHGAALTVLDLRFSKIGAAGASALDALGAALMRRDAQRVASTDGCADYACGEDNCNDRTVVLDVDAAALDDMAGNAIVEDDNNSVEETDDTLPPAITGVAIDYNDNVKAIVVSYSETVDTSSVDLDLLHINHETGTDLVTLTGATVATVRCTSCSTSRVDPRMRGLPIVQGRANR